MTELANFSVRVATPDELPAIGRFRYAALAMDPGFCPTEEMRATKQLIDAWDPISRVLIAGDASDIRGTFRIVPLRNVVAQYGRDAALLAFKHLGLVRALEVFPLDAINVVGRLAVAANVRGSRIVVDLLSAALFGCLSRGERLSLADCSPPLLRLYSRLAGFFRSGPNFHDPIYGVKAPMMGTLADHQALLRSSIGPVASAFSDDEAARVFRLQIESEAATLQVA